MVIGNHWTYIPTRRQFQYSIVMMTNLALINLPGHQFVTIRVAKLDPFQVFVHSSSVGASPASTTGRLVIVASAAASAAIQATSWRIIVMLANITRSGRVSGTGRIVMLVLVLVIVVACGRIRCWLRISHGRLSATGTVRPLGLLILVPIAASRWWTPIVAIGSGGRIMVAIVLIVSIGPRPRRWRRRRATSIRIVARVPVPLVVLTVARRRRWRPITGSRLRWWVGTVVIVVVVALWRIIVIVVIAVVVIVAG